MKKIMSVLQRQWYVSLVWAALMPFAAQGQATPSVDITWAMNTEGQIEVKMRPDGPFSDYFSSHVFTLRWLDASGAGLGSVVQELPYSALVPVFKSGPEVVSGIYRYQIFVGFGNYAFTEAEPPVSWEAAVEYTICRINVNNGSALFEIVNDEWTSDLNNNGDFYVSLNGVESSGIIYSPSTSVITPDDERSAMSLSPNPAKGTTALKVELAKELVRADLFIDDAAGRVVSAQTLSLAAGAWRGDLDVSGLPSGVYTVRLLHEAGVSQVRLVVAER
jgi:hypothetical protein